MSKIEVIARGIIVRGGHVLLCANREGGYFYLPGGHVEVGESAADALAREMIEESGEAVRVGRVVRVEEHAFRQKHKARHEVNILMEATLARSDAGAGLPTISSLEDYIAFAWVPVKSLHEVDLRPAHHAETVMQAAKAKVTKSAKRSLIMGRTAARRSASSSSHDGHTVFASLMSARSIPREPASALPTTRGAKPSRRAAKRKQSARSGKAGA